MVDAQGAGGGAVERLAVERAGCNRGWLLI